jgi:transposase
LSFRPPRLRLVLFELGGGGTRAIGVDVHRDFCEVAIAQDGGVRSVGRVLTTPAALELFARSLAPDDVVAMEAIANALAIAGIVEPHVARVVFANPNAVKRRLISRRCHLVRQRVRENNQCRRRDSNPRHAAYDPAALWLPHRASGAGWTRGWTQLR